MSRLASLSVVRYYNEHTPMSTSSSFLHLLQMILPQALVLVVYLAGGLVALSRWRLHPRASLLVLIAAGLGCVTILGMTTIHFVIPQMMSARAIPTESLTYIYLAVSLGSSLLHAVVLGLLFAAAFAPGEPRIRPQGPPA